MPFDDNDWLKALQGKNASDESDTEWSLSKMVGKQLRQEYQDNESTEAAFGLDTLIKRLYDEKLLTKTKKIVHFPQWSYALAASIIMVAVIPIYISNQSLEPSMEQSIGIDDYPVLRGQLDTIKVITDQPLLMANTVSNTLNELKIENNLYRHGGNILLRFQLEQTNKKIIKALSDHSITDIQTGINRIEFVKPEPGN